MSISVPRDLFIYLHITHIVYIYDVLVTLQLFTFYMYISHNSTKTYLNIHDNTFVSTLSLIFTSQSHIILSGYDSQETLFYLKAKLTFIDKSIDLRDPLYSYQSVR